MREPMERNQRQLLIGWTAFVVAVDGILKGVVRGTVAHNLAVVLIENPVVTLPIVADLFDKVLLRFTQPFEPSTIVTDLQTRI